MCLSLFHFIAFFLEIENMFLAGISLDRLGIHFIAVFHKLKDFTFPSIKEIILINFIT